MRVVSMVPSWTETLIEAGVEVVGRTRFCIHPAEKVRGIPAVGGTKNVDWQKLESLSADLLILDHEENPKSMSDESPIEVLATHLRSVADVAPELRAIAKRLESGHGTASNITSDATAIAKLEALAMRWQTMADHPGRKLQWSTFPGVMEWLGDIPDTEFDRAVYLIWKNPDMAAGPSTFIASVLGKLGLEQSHLWPGLSGDIGDREVAVETSAAARYPVVDWESVPKTAVILASSEPFPFHKHKSELLQGFRGAKRPVAVVDGEAFSWFGLRSLRFLEKSLT